MKKPHTFAARIKPFKVELDFPCVISGYSKGGKYASFYKPIPVKKGDVFHHTGRELILNGKPVERKARPLKRLAWKISWVAKRLRMAVFQERDRIYSRRLKKFTKRFGKPYWVACDLRSYHIGTGEDIVSAVQSLTRQCQVTDFGAKEERALGNRVIRWRCLLPQKEVKEMEVKAKKTGFILDGVEVPPAPKHWKIDLKRLRASEA